MFLRVVGCVDGGLSAVHPEPAVDVGPAVETLRYGDHPQLLALFVTPQYPLLYCGNTITGLQMRRLLETENTQRRTTAPLRVLPKT